MNPLRVPVITPVSIDAREFWRSTDEVLPEPAHVVLLARRLLGEWVIESGYRRRDGSWHPGGSTPTHWMPIPAPPADVQSDDLYHEPPDGNCWGPGTR